MTAVARFYLFLCVLTGAVLLAPEALPRPYRGMGGRDLRRVERGIVLDRNEVDERFKVARPEVVPGLEAEWARLTMRIDGLRRERTLRRGQTSAVALLFLASIVFFLTHVRSAMRVWRATPSRAGLVEVMEPQSLAVTDEQAREHARKLLRSRAAAMHAVYPRIAYRCGYCGTRARWKRLGRIGKRTLRRRPPPDAKDLGIVLAEGWWHEADPPVPCVKCGSSALAE